jgi:hypothetical protein
MQRSIVFFVFMLLLLFPCSQVSAQDSWTAEQLEILASMELLSATTAPGGTGADGYAAVLAEEFSRWTTGSNIVNSKQAWVDGVRGWFDDGWRVVARDQDVVEILVIGEYAFTRRVVEETYQSPSGESSVSKAGLAETWIRGEGVWLLLRVNADVLTGQ